MPRLDPARNRRRIIRLSILAGVIVLLVGGIYALFQVQLSRQRLDTDQVLQQAREAHEAEDYARVLKLLEQTSSASNMIPEIRDDAALIKLYIDARRETPLDRGEHLLRIVPPLQQVVRLTPDDEQARRDLFELMLLLQRHSETKRLAEQLLQQYPEDVELWRALGTANTGLGANSKAIDAYREAGKLDPLDVYIQVEIIRLLQDSGLPIEPFVDNAKAVYAQHHGDPRAELMLALANLAKGEVKIAEGLLRIAADREPPDERFVPVLVHWLDKAELFDVSLAYLERVSEGGVESYPARETIYRTYDAGDMRGVLDRLRDADPATAYPDLVAVWALASAAQSDDDKAGRLAASLADRPEPIAQAWARVLPLLLEEQDTAGLMIDTVNEVLQRDADNPTSIEVSSHPYLHLFLGEAYLKVDEPDAAIRAFVTAASNRPSWAAPHFSLAEIYLGQFRAREALLHAQAAWLRQPSTATAALRVQAELAAADPDDPADVNAALQSADQLLAQIPDHPGILPETVGLLARSGRATQARQRIADALRLDPPASAGLLTALAEQARRHQLQLTEAVWSGLRALSDQSPALVLQRALTHAQSGQPEQGRSLIDQAMPDNANVAWRVALGRYLNAVNDEGATVYWITLANDLPDNLGIQLEALQQTRARNDTAFTQQAIERLRKISGESSVHWRLEQARLLMRTGSPEEQIKQALALLQDAERLAPTRVQTHLELARGYERLGDLNTAEDSARDAKRLAPNAPGVTLRLGAILHRLGRFDEARVELLAVADDPGTTPGQRTDACMLLYQQGERQVLRPLLESMREDSTADNTALLLLARVYIALEEYALADAVCDTLLASADLDTTLFISAYFEQTGRPQRAEQARQTAAQGLTPADRLTLDSEGALRLGRIDDAMRLIVEAADTEPTNARRWRSAVRVALLLSRTDQAIVLAQRGLDQAGQDAGLQTLVDHRELIKPLQVDRSLIPFGIAIVSDERSRQTAVRVLRAVAFETDASAGAQQLAELAADEADFQALHELAAERLFAAEQYREAYQLAKSAMSRFPNSAVSARTTALAAYRLSDWVALLSSAEAWRERDPAGRHYADLLTAAAQDALRRYGDVVQTLEPHFGKLEGGPDANPQHYILYTRALVRSEKAEQALTLLRPLVQSSEMAWQIAIERIGEDLASHQTVTRWLEALNTVAGDNPAMQFALSEASFSAGLRLNHPELVASARQRLDRLFELQGPHPVQAYDLLGRIAQAQGDLSIAESSFRRVYEQTPDDPHVLNSLAMVLVQRNTSLEEAEQFAERANQLQNDDANLLDTLALVRLRLRKLDAAEQAITRAIHLEPDSPAWRLAHADILEARGETERAAKIRERYAQQENN